MERFFDYPQLQSLSETVAGVIDLDVEIVDCKLKRLAATGLMARNVGVVQQSGWLNRKVINSGEGIVIARPGYDEACNGCMLQKECSYQAGMLAPIFFDEQVVGVLNFVGFSEKQLKIFKAKQAVYQKFILLLGKLIQIDYMTHMESLHGETAIASIIENLDKGLIILESTGKVSYISDKAKKILDKYCLFNESVIGQESVKDRINKEKANHLIGSSPGLELIKRQIDVLADQDTTVLISGESGTGKELVAKMIHFQGRRGRYPFVDINCAALPDNLVESELFGYVDGAFTGARKGGSIGKIELANKGTLFLDEIGDMTPATQAKLLRALEEREIYRVGSNKSIPVDIRVIAATNRDLAALVREGRFRKDLFYRLNIVPITLPSLKERREDIPALVQFFIEYYCRRIGKKTLVADKKVMDLLLRYEWPGNIRELRNAIEHAVIFSRENIINLDSLPNWLTSGIKNIDNYQYLDDYKEKTEKDLLIQTSKKYGYDKKMMACALNISLTTLYRKLNKYHLK